MTFALVGRKPGIIHFITFVFRVAFGRYAFPESRIHHRFQYISRFHRILSRRRRSLNLGKCALKPTLLKPALLEPPARPRGRLLSGELDDDQPLGLGLGLPRAGAGVGVPDHGLHVLEALLVAVVVAAEVGLVVVHAGVALGAEGAVEGLLGLARG